MFSAFRKNKILRNIIFPIFAAIIIILIISDVFYTILKSKEAKILQQKYGPVGIDEAHDKSFETHLSSAALVSKAVMENDKNWNLDSESIPKLPVMFPNKTYWQVKWNCSNFPDLYNLKFSNEHWQVEETTNQTYYLYSAYLDIRGKPFYKESRSSSDGIYVRVLGMGDTFRLAAKNSSLKVCQFWFENEMMPKITNISEIRMIWNYKWGTDGHYFPYWISCPLPQGTIKPPISVSLASCQCANATNNLKITHRELINSTFSFIPKKDFAVCVKALDFPHEKMRNRLIEWIETLKIFASKIYFYEYFVNSEIKKALDYYEKLGKIEVKEMTLPGELPNHAQLRHIFLKNERLEKRFTEIIPYNDCLLRNIYKYKYIAIIDTDEVILPVQDITWTELLDQVKIVDIGTQPLAKTPITTFCFRNFYFLDGMMNGKEMEIMDIPSDFYMYRKIYRSNNATKKGYVKCFHSTEETLGVHNHLALFCREGIMCKAHFVSKKHAKMNHYRATCVRDVKNCSIYMKSPVKDTTLWRYKDKILKSMEGVLKDLNNLQNNV